MAGEAKVTPLGVALTPLGAALRDNPWVYARLMLAATKQNLGPEDAKDLCHHAVCKAYEREEAGEADDLVQLGVYPFVFRVMIGEGGSWRRERRTRKTTEFDPDRHAQGSAANPEQTHAKHAGEADEDYLRRRLREIIAEPKYAVEQAVVESWQTGESHAELAARTGYTPKQIKAARQRIHEIAQRIKNEELS